MRSRGRETGLGLGRWGLGHWLLACSMLAVLSGTGRSSMEIAPDQGTQRDRTPPHVAPAQLVRPPVSFERNDGQVAAETRFLLRADGYSLFVCDSRVVVAPSGLRSALGISVVGAQERARPTGCDALAARSHYLRGNDRASWVRKVPHFGEIRYPDALPGIDQIWRTRNGHAELQFLVRPGAAADAIDLTYDGCESLVIEDDRLVARLRGGEVSQSRPVAYQLDGEEHTAVDVRYVLVATNTVRFSLGDYDPTRALVIDPEIEASTYFGGTDRDRVRAMTVDSAGACYVTGSTTSADLPTTVGAFDTEYNNSEEDAFVAKLSPDLSELVYATYVGGDDDDGDEEEGSAIAVDSTGNACVAGATYSSDFPEVNPVQSGYSDGGDAFVLRLNAAGSDLLFSSYLGGGSYDRPSGVALDAAGNMYVVGTTGSSDFPLAAAYQSTRTGFGADAFVARIRNGVLAYSTYFGGAADDNPVGIAVDATSTAPGGTAIVIAGWTTSTDLPIANAVRSTLDGLPGRPDGFVSRFVPNGSALEYSTYLGGTESDQILGLAMDRSGGAYVTGETWSLDFPDTLAPVEKDAKAAGGSVRPDAFVTKLSSAGALTYSTLIGGDSSDQGTAIAVGKDGDAWVLGSTNSSDFPLVEPIQGALTSNPSLFVSQVSADGASLVFSSYLGTVESSLIGLAGFGIATDRDGAVFIAGGAGAGFPTTSGAFQPVIDASDFQSGFVTKLAGPGNAPPPNTIRSFILPKKLQVSVGSASTKGGGPRPGVKLTAFFDSGPTDVDLSDTATLTLGPRQFAIPSLTPISKGRAFAFQGDGLKLTIRPSPLGTSKGKLTLTFDGDLGPSVDLNGAFLVRFENESGIDAKGECVLSDGAFTFGREAGELIAPELSIRKAKAKLPGVGKHNFKFVAGFTTDGHLPTTAPDLHVAFGDVFAADIPSSAMRLAGKNFRLDDAVGGIDAFTLTYAKERISVRGGDIDLGDIDEGPTPMLLIFTQGSDVRAVFVRMVRKGKSLKY